MAVSAGLASRMLSGGDRTVGQVDVMALGTQWEKTDHVALACLRCLNRPSVFCNAPTLDLQVRWGLVELTRPDIYCRRADGISGMDTPVSIRARAPAKKTLEFPRAVRLRDLSTGRVPEPAAGEFSFTMDRGGKRGCWRWEQAGAAC